MGLLHETELLLEPELLFGLVFQLFSFGHGLLEAGLIYAKIEHGHGFHRLLPWLCPCGRGLLEVGLIFAKMYSF